MVLRQRSSKMASEQPVKKKQRIEDANESADEPDFMRSVSDNGLSSLSALHLSLPADVNEDDIKSNNVENSETSRTSGNEHMTNILYTSAYISTSENISFEPAPDIMSCREYIGPPVEVLNSPNYISPQAGDSLANRTLTNHNRLYHEDDFQNQLIRQCLCSISEATLRKPFEGHQIVDDHGVRSAMLAEWSTPKVLQFLSNLQLLFDIYLKQNNKGYICSRIVAICDTIARNEYNLMEQIISLCEVRNKYINYMAARVISSFFIIAKTNINNEWLETILGLLTIENVDYVKMNFALEVVKRVVEWKDVETHVLEETSAQEIAGTSTEDLEININCTTVPYSDSESFDTSSIKGLIIRSLVIKWPDLISKIQYLVLHNNCVQSQTCIINFLALWESIISVRANLSVIDTKPFYAHLDIFVSMLHGNLPPIIWKQLLSLFNEVLCYGSTLALQDMLPDDTCKLAHFIVRYVKDHSLLDSLPYRRNEGFTVNSFVGTIPVTYTEQSTIDKTLMQKMVLLVLKSVAISIKETRSDSSDSSVGSDDSDYNQDMLVIGRSMKEVLRKVEVFMKNSLEFHPETPFSKILIHLFGDQDDYMIEAMVCTLDITVGIPDRNAVFPELLAMLNPTFSFVEFLKVVSHDSDVLLDYLVSNETCFLLYLLRYLKYIRKNWSTFTISCSECSSNRINELDNTMTVLIRLRIQIERLVSKDLFPYNIDPVLRLLQVCENLYEGNEYS